MALVPITLGSIILPAMRETLRWLWKIDLGFFAFGVGKKVFPVPHEAVFALQNWQTDAGADCLKLGGFNPQFLHLCILTEHHKMPLMWRSSISLFPCPACSMSPCLGFGGAGTRIPGDIPRCLQREGCYLGISPLAWGSVWRMRLAHPTLVPEVARPRPSSVSQGGRCRFLIATQALSNGGDSVYALLISQGFWRGLYQARSPSGINQHSFIEVKGPNSHLE